MSGEAQHQGTPYDLAALERSLSGSIFAGKLHFAATTDSTNTDALEAARRDAAHGTVHFADAQSAGRGRGDHKWQSTSGLGIYVSLLLRPQIESVRLPLLPLIAGLAAADAIRTSASLTVDLRWPNDLLIGPRKTGGILVEAKSDANRVTYAVVGIGINVHQREFAGDLATPATSLDLASGRVNSRQDVLVALLLQLERELGALEDAASTQLIADRLRSASTWIDGRPVRVHGPQACVGVTAGLDEHGFLRVRTDADVVTVQTGGLRDAIGLE